MPGKAGVRRRNTGISGDFDAEKARKCPEKPGNAGVARCAYTMRTRLFTFVDEC
jgi:hypothetical protein